MTNGGRVRPITPYVELREFITFLYGDTDGFAYSPTKDPATKEWTENYFRWPRQERELINHIMASKDRLEVYLSPGMFKEPSSLKEHFLGSHVVWAELDYGLPSQKKMDSLGLSLPSRVIQSSEKDHQHWYWKLDYFETDQTNLEKITRAVTYALDGDLGTWNCNRVLRPPGTAHHESRKETKQLKRDNNSHSIAPFVSLPEPPASKEQSGKIPTEIPDLQDIIASYKWPASAFELYKKNSVDKDRSSALCRMAYECAEMGMQDNEILAVLLSCDERWKKFVNRDDRLDKLFDIILRARLKYPVLSSDAPLEDEFVLMGFYDFIKTEYHFEWVIDGVLQKHGVGLLSSQPGVGKTQFTMGLAISMALGVPYLNWPIQKPRKVSFISEEMGPADTQKFFKQMAQFYTPEELSLLQKNLFILAWGESIKLDKPNAQAKLLRMMDKYKLEGLFFDSLGTSLSKSPNDDQTVNDTFDFLKGRVIKDYDSFVWFIHHDRKPQIGNKKPRTLADIYGSQYIEAHITAGVNLWRDKPNSDHPIDVTCTKMRMANDFDDFRIERDPRTLSFKIIEDPRDNTPTGGRIYGRGPEQRIPRSRQRPDDIISI